MSKLNPNNSEFSIPTLYQPQIKFWKCLKSRVLYGGARGGGKSFVIRYLAVFLALMFPGCRILILRRTFPELKANHIDQLRAILKIDRENALATYNAKNMEFRMFNGSVIKLGHCFRDNDIDHYQGQQYEFIFMDEATHFTEKMYHAFEMINRLNGEFLQKDKIPKPQMFLTANPGGVGHTWVKRLFIDRKYKENENPDNYEFIPAKVYDNTYLMENNPEYEQMLKALPEKQRKAMLDGDWNVFDGQFFEEFDETTHCYHDNDYNFSEMSVSWYRTRDYGLDMTDCLWFCVDSEGTMYFDQELARERLTVSASGKMINENTLIGREPILDICPPDMWNKQRETGRSSVDILRDECNQHVTKANNDRIVGWQLVKEKLQFNEVTGKPSLLINVDKCPNLVNSLKLIQFSESNPNDCAKEPHDLTHATDALRYGVTSYTYKPEIQNVSNLTRNFNPFAFATNTGEYSYLDEEEDYDDSDGGWFL